MYNITRRDPFRDMVSLRSAMDSLLESALVGPQAQGQFSPQTWNLAMDVSETENDFVVKASLPGINPDDLDITFDNGVLTIKGETREEKETQEEKYHLRERRYGSFARSIQLPTSVRAEEIQANYQDGVLILHLPKAEEAKPKRVTVKQNSSKVVESGQRQGNGSR